MSRLTFQRSIERLNVTFGTGEVIIRREGASSYVLMAKELGREVRDGTEHIYLDRLVHEPGQDWGEFKATGAVSTILSRAVKPAPAQDLGKSHPE